ncbi:MAG: adenylate/guanylate cyclase domain-containing protein [Chloroflexi bacterium]|nr:adenylate/guanylate cyclase domain-containing protein [Chloroflexota bacterium]
MEQQIRFCTTSDGVRIAYATIGQGPPLVEMSPWVGHLQFEWDDPQSRAFYEGLAAGRMVVRFDKRGTGLSDRDVDDLSVESRLIDLRAVIDALGPERFDLMGVSESGPTALIYTARNPQQVSRLIIYGSFHRWPHPPGIVEPLISLIRSQWGMGSAALSAIFVPSGDPEEVAGFTELQRLAASAETAARITEVNTGIDVTELLNEIRCPTLVVHRRNDTVCPFDVAREMAALLPNARFEPLEGDIHPPYLGDTAAVVDAIDAFLAGRERLLVRRPYASSPGPLTVLFTDIEGSTPLTERLGDAKAQEVLRTHNAIVRGALMGHGGREIKHTGDGIMASFPSASQALTCAVAIQKALAERNRGVGAALAPSQDAASGAPTEAIRVRIGLNAGEPVAEERDLFGTAVQVAARICQQAEPGQILVSDVVRQLAAGKGFKFDQRGDFLLKGFSEPFRLFAVSYG